MPSDRYFRTADWKRLRAKALQRQPVCVTPGCGGHATFADHIVPRRQGGLDTLENLQSMCAICYANRRGN